MDDRLKAQVMFAILSLAPMGSSSARFKQLADAADPEEIWNYYTRAMETRGDVAHAVQSSGKISFEDLHPAMKAIHAL